MLSQLGGQIPYVLDGGPCQAGIESTVVGFDKNGTPVVYRAGAISLEMLQAVVPTSRLRTTAETAKPAASPGLLPYHYSPHTPLRLFGPGLEDVPAFDSATTGALVLHTPLPGLPPTQQVVLSPGRADLAEAAHGLYAALHHLDALGLKLLLAERMPEKGLGVAVNERLEKAAARG